MAQSLETRVTDLINEITALKQRYERYPDVFDERLEQFTASFQNTIDNLDAGTTYVDQGAGDDNNDGARARPVASLSAALARIPLHGSGTVSLAADYTLHENVLWKQRSVNLDLGGHTLESAPSSIVLSARCSAIVANGQLIGGAGDAAGAVFQSAGNTQSQVVFNRCDIALGDSTFFLAAANSQNLVDMCISDSALTRNPQATAEANFISAQALFLNVERTSLPANTAWADVVSANALVSNVL